MTLPGWAVGLLALSAVALAGWTVLLAGLLALAGLAELIVGVGGWR